MASPQELQRSRLKTRGPAAWGSATCRTQSRTELPHRMQISPLITIVGFEAQHSLVSWYGAIISDGRRAWIPAAGVGLGAGSARQITARTLMLEERW